MNTSGSLALLPRREAARLLGVRPQTLALWATTGRYGLPYIRVGRLAMYRREDLEQWIAGRTATSTGELAAKAAKAPTEEVA